MDRKVKKAERNKRKIKEENFSQTTQGFENINISFIFFYKCQMERFLGFCIDKKR